MVKKFPRKTEFNHYYNEEKEEEEDDNTSPFVDLNLSDTQQSESKLDFEEEQKENLESQTLEQHIKNVSLSKDSARLFQVSPSHSNSSQKF